MVVVDHDAEDDDNDDGNDNDHDNGDDGDNDVGEEEDKRKSRVFWENKTTVVLKKGSRQEFPPRAPLAPSAQLPKSNIAQ